MLLLCLLDKMPWTGRSNHKKSGAPMGGSVYWSHEQKPKRWEMSGGVGDLSVRLGYDIRDIWMCGYSDEQINGVLIGEDAQ